MGRTVDQEVHAAFVEFRAKEDDKCLSVQCIYCQQIRAKNTSRQKQHLLECPGLRGHPNAPQPNQPSQAPNGIGPSNGYPGTPNGPTATPGGPGNPSAMPTPNGALMANGVNPHATPLQTPLQSLSRPPMATPGPPTGPPGSAPPSAAPSRPTPKPKVKNAGSNLPAPPLDDVHAAFVEFRAKEEDKCLSVQCIYCQQVRAKNTSRQRQHLLECPTYLSVMKDSIPANNLLHTFPEGDVARSLQIPAPTLELDFRMSIKMNPKVTVGQSIWGGREWVSFLGGQWAGRWGKGIVLPGGQDTQIVTKDFTTNLRASYMLQTADEPPAYVIVRAEGWLTGAKDVLEKVNDPAMADGINPSSYKYRINLSMETGDERYTFLNTLMWVGSGCRRGQEVIFDAFRVN
ncbi:uncharacterized protein N7473_005281 [Penicillium subrubescens]|jgi:hypothetical protein|uniref:UPF0311 protein YveG n=1 Tax=Penicillium subrubescens TaxID=1316194 RepID=A0A1Q5UM88_9EURO|nr:uncharacterized protein N7473_005281 [Penicillium subrubescens]KAJ5895882.1 hypothetical protein N7473_005281 [Penicillium subrubescens]OKP13582.1 UPF0311 protein YveG [Penicillium subrubescens]